MIVKSMIAGMYEEVCHIAMDEATKEAVVMDPGGNGEMIERELTALGANVKYILLTHGHMDHVGAVDYLAEKFNAPVYINKAEIEYMKNDNFVFGNIKKIDGYLNDGDVLDFANTTIKVIHTPGHTKGGTCLLIDDKLFTGDTLFQCAVGRWDFAGGNFAELINGIKTKLLVLDKNTEVYPGHGPMSTIGYEERNNQYLD